MEKSIILGDVHIGVRNDSDIYMDNQLNFLCDITIPYMVKHNIAHIIQVGDLFDKRRSTNHKTLHTFKRKFFDLLQQHNITMDVIVGNHDCYYTNDNYVNAPALLLREYENIAVYSRPTEIHFGGDNIFYVPWINKDNYELFKERLDKSTANTIIGHLEINGFEMHKNSIKCTTGLNSTIFSGIDNIISGHFHNPSHKKNIHYIGAIAPYTWNDFDCDRGFFVYTKERGFGDLEFIKNPLTLYKRIQYNDSFDAANFDFSELDGMIVQVVVAEKTDVMKYDTFISLLNTANTVSYKVIDNTSLDDIQVTTDETESENTTDFVMKYIDEVGLVHPDRVKSLFVELYTQAINESMVG